MSTSDDVTWYERFGGMPFFERLVDAFYEGIQTDEVLLPMYEGAGADATLDLAPAKRRLTLFLAQYWGGPMTYMEERGHPKLRARHFPFQVGPDERDRWLRHMTAAIYRVTDGPELRTTLLQYFVPAVEHLRNDSGLRLRPS